MRPGLTDNYHSDLITETSVPAATLLLTALSPGPPGAAQLLAAQPGVAGQTLAGEGGRAVPVETLLTQWHTVSTILATLGEPLATHLH